MRFKKITTWVVLADGAHARIFENSGPGTGLVEINSWDSPSARKPTRDLGTDRPGRGHESATYGRHALAAREDWHEGEKANFVHDVAAYLNDRNHQGAFDELVIAAPPRALGELRKAIDSTTAGRLKVEINKDLTKIPQADLGEHLSDLVLL